MPTSESYILSALFYTTISAVLFGLVLAVLAGIWPNNTALCISVLIWPSGLLAIISAPIATINAYRQDTTDPLIGFDAWCLLAILSNSFALAAIVVLNNVGVLVDNPYLIWN